MLAAVLTAKQEGAGRTTGDVEDIAVADARASVGLAQGEMVEVDAQLADVVTHQLEFELTGGEVAGHEAGEVRRDQVGDVVAGGGVADGHNYQSRREI